MIKQSKSAVRRNTLKTSPGLVSKDRSSSPCAGVSCRPILAKPEKKHMFFHLNLNKDIEIEPRFFGPRLQEILKQKVTSEVKIANMLSCCRDRITVV